MSQFRRAGGAIATSAPISERQYQSMMERRRYEDNRLADLAQYHQQSALMKAANNSNMKVDTMRRQRRAQEQNSEIERDMQMEASIRDAEQKRILRQQEEALQEAMAKIEQTKLSDEMNVRRVCAQSDELKELKSLLSAARLNKERATQLVETQVNKQQETLADKEYAAKLDADRQKAELDEAVAMQSAYEHKIFARKALQDQMVEREQDKLRLIEESRREKERVDAVVADIIESDRQKMEAVKRKQAELQGDIKQYLSQRAVWRQQEAERTKQELRKIQEYQEQQEQRQNELMQKRKQRDGQQDALLQAIAADLARKRQEAEEKQMLLMELYEEEREQRLEEEARQREQRRAEFGMQVRAANDQLLAYREARQKEQQLEEAEYRRQLMAQFEQDRKMEQLSADRRRREMASYRAEVEKLVEERKRSMASQLDKDIAERQAAQEKEFQRRQIVEEERAKLLREHAADLADFLPKGVFRSSEEYERFMGRLPERNEQPAHGLGPRKFKIWLYK